MMSRRKWLGTDMPVFNTSDMTPNFLIKVGSMQQERAAWMHEMTMRDNTAQMQESRAVSYNMARLMLFELLERDPDARRYYHRR